MSDQADEEVTEPTPLEVFERFAWPVPTAFAGALAGFRFEQGDVLFREPGAYDTVSDAASAGGTALQVLLPKRSGRATPSDAEGDRRTVLWESEVVLERVDLAEGGSATLTTSQGRLLMTLWTGDEDWLDAERGAPPVPLAARDLAGRLEQAKGTFAKGWKTGRGVGFVFVVDLASDASRAKAAAIEDALAPLGELRRLARSPERAGVSEPERFHPALEIRGLAVAGTSEEKVQLALRGALYSGSTKDTEPAADAEVAADRFSVSRHGLLVVLGAAD